MQATTQKVTFQGKPLTLTGNEVQIGQSAPDASASSSADGPPHPTSTDRINIMLII